MYKKPPNLQYLNSVSDFQANKQHRRYRFLLAPMALAVFSTLPVPVALAQEKQTLVLEEVIVTARRRTESMQEVPIAVTAFSNDFLRENEINQLEDIRTIMPSLGISTGSPTPNNPIISLRGQRPNDLLITQDAAVPLYFAEVVMTPTNGTNLSMYDLQSVQVLKGPQGTLFGRNSTGGALLFTPASPGNEFSGHVEAVVGDYGAVGLEGALDIPVSDALSMRLAGKFYERDGYQDNLADNELRGDEEFWNEDSKAARLSVRWTPGERLENLLVVDWSENKMNAMVPTPQAFLPVSGEWGCTICFLTNSIYNADGQIDDALARQRARDWNEIETDYAAEEEIENLLLSNITTWEINDKLRIKNVFGYRDLELSNTSDVDGTWLPLFGSQTFTSGPGDAGPVTINGPKGGVDAEQFSNEFQLLGEAFDDRLEWIAGLYYFDMDGSQSLPVQFTVVQQNSPFGDAHNRAYAAYGEATWTFNEEWALTAGLRYTRDEREITARNKRGGGPWDTGDGTCLVEDSDGNVLPVDQCARTEEDEWNAPTWRIIASWTPTEDTLVYGSVSTGYRTGGFNLRAEENIQFTPYDEENVTTFEIGHKTDWDFPGFSLMRSNLALYYQDYQDIQTTEATSAGSGGFATIIVNAAAATIWGAELELTFVPTANLEFGFSYSYVNTSYDDWERFNSNTGMIDDISHFDFVWTPENTLTSSVRYALPLSEDIGTVSLRANVYWQDKLRAFADVDKFEVPGIDNDPLNDSIFIDSYSVWGARIDWHDVMQSNFDLAAWVKNAGDEEYATGGLNVLTSLSWAANVYGPPRTYGVSLRYRF